jgi:predicted phage-related endonuclease
MAIWLDKTGQLPNSDAGEPALWGKLLEEPVIQEFERRSGLHVLARQDNIWHPTVPFMRATLDGKVFEEKDGTWSPAIGVFEGKTASGRAYDWAHGVPMHVQIQVQHNMAVAGLAKAWVACLITAPVIELRWWEVDRDDSLVDTIIEIEREFWKLVETKTPPPADESYGSFDAVRRAYAAKAGTRRELNSEHLRLIHDRMEAWNKEKSWADTRRQIETQIMTILGDAEEGAFKGDVLVTWREQDRKSVDMELLASKYPDVAREVSLQNRSRVLRFSYRKLESRRKEER